MQGVVVDSGRICISETSNEGDLSNFWKRGSFWRMLTSRSIDFRERGAHSSFVRVVELNSGSLRASASSAAIVLEGKVWGEVGYARIINVLGKYQGLACLLKFRCT